MARIYFVVVRKMVYQTYYDFRVRAKPNVKTVSKEAQNTTINLPSYIFKAHSLIHLAHFSFILFNFCQLFEKGRVGIVSMFRFLETDIKDQQKYEKIIQTSLDNVVNDLSYEIKFQNCAKNKNKIFLRERFSFFFFKKKFFCFWKKT